MAGHWIDKAIRHPGALHKELGVPKGQKIPQKKLTKAADAGGKLGERARLAETLEHMHHDGGDHGSGQSLPHAHKRQEARGQRRAANPHGNPGYHPSTDGYHHDDYRHTSEDR